MRLTCELELTYSLAVSSGSLSSRSSRSRAVIIVGKKPGPTAANGRREELYVIVSTTKNVTGSKYKVRPPHTHTHTHTHTPAFATSLLCNVVAGEGECM